jgi:hypothetical protein
MMNISRKRFLTRLAVVTLSLVAPLVPSGDVSAAYPPGPIGPFVFVYPESPTVQAGENFKVFVVGCRDGETCPISFNPTVNAVGVKGVATATFRAPCKPGVYPISAVVRGKTYTNTVTVVGSCDGVPATGISNLPTALSTGLGALVTGFVLLLATRSRRRLRLAL